MRVLVVHRLPHVRRELRRLLSTHRRISRVLLAGDAFAARQLVVEHEPDAIVVGLDLPRVSGLRLLRALHKHRPTPCIVFSSLVARPEVRADASRAGAVAIIERSDGARQSGLRAVAAALERIHASGSSDVGATRRRHLLDRPPEVIAVGSSTGGPLALQELLAALPTGLPPIVVAQHMPERQLPKLTRSLQRFFPGPVMLAEVGTHLQDGHCYFAPGHAHLAVRREGSRLVAEIQRGGDVHFQTPSVDVLFRSIVPAVGGSAIGIMLTGMGRDGADAMRTMYDGGVHTIAQDQATSTVYGMPREAVRAAAVAEVLPLRAIGPRVATLVRSARFRSRRAG